MELRALDPPEAPAPLGRYSQSYAVDIPGGSLVFLAGQVGIDADGNVGETTGRQAEIAFESILSIVAAHGGGPRSIVKLTYYFTDVADRAAVVEVRDRLLGDHAPVSTAVGVAALVRPELRLEIDAVAAIPRSE